MRPRLSLRSSGLRCVAGKEPLMKNTPFDLTGKVAVITGSSRGIGRASAELLAKLGAKVVISSRKVDACQEVAEGIKKAGGDAHVIPCNISRREEVEVLIKGATLHYGKIDILVCNAAVNPYYGPLLDIKDDAFDKIMGSNVKSNIWLCALAIPQMAERAQPDVALDVGAHDLVEGLVLDLEQRAVI